MKVHTDLNTFNIQKPVITIGVFDGVHLGHRKVISKLLSLAQKEKGESVIVTLWPHPRLVLNDDIDSLRLLNTLEEKKMLLEEQHIDHLVILPFTKELSRMSACRFVEDILVNKLKVSHLLIGHDHHFGKDRGGDYHDLKDCAQSNNFKLTRVDPEKDKGSSISSTMIRKQLLDGNLKTANQYLGYEYFIRGKVVGGNRIGKKIGFPTANIEIPESYKLIPRDGVYVVKTSVGPHLHNGMLNIGKRPTINKHGYKKTIEVHLFEFEENIYDQKITLHFIERIRDEQKFKHVDQLTEQLKKDKETALKILT